MRVQHFRGITACTPNESEVEQILGVRIGDDLRALEAAGREMLRRTGMQALLVTRGSRGMALFEPDAPTRHIPIFGSDEIADVTGAGDTVIATLTLALVGGRQLLRAARLANYAGGLVVMKRGTATVSAEELRAAIQLDGRAARPELKFRPPTSRDLMWSRDFRPGTPTRQQPNLPSGTQSGLQFQRCQSCPCPT